MKRIVYTRPDGGVSVVVPAIRARLCSAVTLTGERHVYDPPMHFDELIRVFKTDKLSPEWAQSDDEFIEWIRAKDVPADATNVQIVDEADIPTDRTFRNAWKQCPMGKPEVDMDKARDIHRDNLRAARKPKLQALDVEFMRVVENGAPTSDIAAAKQALRDVTKHPDIDAAATPEELKAVWPVVLQD